ncbi:colicin-like bacteriocin tRNase domain-containing protein [Arsenophonus sp.]|uniref:colicin-like bacteriocin tRNase domain-containing protein n=1 Tax=Arsenophonus sp. TaxID=1872640 RepID=UPI0028635A86|nr:colicin-like bacteriocin tRNase domain-containing protein [Arsenophonus sp.]MDR5617948.1 colicin-like bacteriocin tRNase domain-containing protein [Arsenophonus sp.]
MDEKKDSQKTRKKRWVDASDHSGWSSENSPWGGGSSSGRGTGPEGRGDGGGHNSSSRHNLDLSKTPEAMTTMSYVAIPMTVYPVNGVLGFTINWTAIDSALVQSINYLSKALPYAGSLLGGVIAGALYPNDTIVSEKKEQEMLTHSQAFRIADKTQGYKITSLPASIVSEIPVGDITKRTEAPAKVLSEFAINMNNKKREMAITQQSKPSNIAVIKAEKTSKPNVYTAQIIPGMKPMHIQVNPDKNQAKHSAKVNPMPAINPYLSSPSTKDTHHAFVHFDGKHEPIYVSVSRIPNNNEEQKQVEEVLGEWTSMHPIEVAQLEFDIANKSFVAIDKQYQTELSALNKLQATPEGLTLSDPAKYPLIYQQTLEQRKRT